MFPPFVIPSDKLALLHEVYLGREAVRALRLPGPLLPPPPPAPFWLAGRG